MKAAQFPKVLRRLNPQELKTLLLQLSVAVVATLHKRYSEGTLNQDEQEAYEEIYAFWKDGTSGTRQIQREAIQQQSDAEAEEVDGSDVRIQHRARRWR